MPVIVLGALERHVSIYLQQVRALNLAASLEAREVAVIGGGFAGLTVAAGLAARGRRVSLYEAGPRLLGMQRGNRVRWIHPHIHEWPRPGSLEPRAGLPLMDWEAGYAGDVAEHLLQEFARFDVEVRLSAGRVTPEETGCDTVIMAVGLGRERSFGSLPLHSYWQDATIATPGERKHVFISGVGEGGLIDALYLRLRDFRHDLIARECLSQTEALQARLLELEEGMEDAEPREAAAFLTPAYLALDVPERVDACLRARLREDTRVTLNSPGPQFLTNKADILNRLLISRLYKMGAIEHVAGRLRSIENEVVALDTGHQQRYDQVLIRHGTEPAVDKGYLEERRQKPFDVPVPTWTPRAFLRTVVVLAGLLSPAYGGIGPAGEPVITPTPSPTATTRPTPSPTTPPLNTTVTLPDGQLYTNGAGGYSVVMPSQPKENESSAEIFIKGSTETLQPVRVFHATCQDGDFVCAVSYRDYPPHVIEQSDMIAFLEGSAPKKATVHSKKFVEVSGNLGMEFSGIQTDERGRKYGIRKRVYVVKYRVYELLAAQPVHPNESRLDAFMESFKLIER